MNSKIIVFIFSFLLLGGQMFAQRGYSSASVSMNRANGVVSADQVVVEEYVNYHTHNIPLPRNNQEIALSLDYHNKDRDDVLLQIGIATERLLDYSAMSPINVCIVIDRSGSMSSDNKLEKVKKALAEFVKGLRPADYISIVAYESQANVVLEATKVGAVKNIENIIGSIRSGGSTNLHGGLMLGYKEVEKNYDRKFSNKVILLTDGIANQGVTDPEQIVSDSESYNKKGIDVSTIGVGNDLNHSLLQQIAKIGKGANHFVGSASEDISKTFVDELESLLSPVAKEVSLEFEYPDGMEIIEIFGYAPQYGKNKVSIPLKNINSGLTQVVIVKCKTNQTSKKLPVKATLNYLSCATQEKSSIREQIIVKNEKYSSTEVLKNYYIGSMAKSLRDMAQKVNEREYQEGMNIVDKVLQEMDSKFPNLKDQDMLRVKEMLVSQRDNLEDLVQVNDSNKGVFQH